MQGYLDLWWGVSWHKTYFRVQEDILFFRTNDSTAEGSVYLKIATITAPVEDLLGLNLHTGTHTLSLKAQSLTDRVKWFKCLSENHKLLNKPAENQLQIDQNIDTLHTQLWKTHAALEQQLEEVMASSKREAPSHSVEQLRSTIEEFKLSTHKLLRQLDQHVSHRKLHPHPPPSRQKSLDWNKKEQSLFLSFEEKHPNH